MATVKGDDMPTEEGADMATVKGDDMPTEADMATVGDRLPTVNDRLPTVDDKLPSFGVDRRSRSFGGADVATVEFFGLPILLEPDLVANLFS
jgi:hypothetical protein